MRSHDVILCHVTASSCELQPLECELYSICKFLAFYSHLLVTFGQMTTLPGHFLSPEVTSRHFRHVTAFSCERPPCRKWNVQYTRYFGFLQPLPVTSGQMTLLAGHFRSNEVTWCHFLSRDCLLLRVTAL